MSSHYPELSKFLQSYLDNMANRPILLLNEKQIIAKLFEKTTDNSSAVAKAFSVFFHTRLRRLSSTVRNDAIEFMNSYVKVEEQESDTLYPPLIDGSLHSRFKNGRYYPAIISIKVSKGFSQSILYYAKLLHLLERFIQEKQLTLTGDERAMQEAKEIGTMMGMRVGYTRQELAKIAAAMHVEAQFLLSLPLSVRQDFLKQVRDSSNFNTTYWSDYIRELELMEMETATDPIVDYVHKMWELGKFNPNEALIPKQSD